MRVICAVSRVDPCFHKRGMQPGLLFHCDHVNHIPIYRLGWHKLWVGAKNWWSRLGREDKEEVARRSDSEPYVDPFGEAVMDFSGEDLIETFAEEFFSKVPPSDVISGYCSVRLQITMVAYGRSHDSSDERSESGSCIPIFAARSTRSDGVSYCLSCQSKAWVKQNVDSRLGP